ncbi:MAG: hypothetical protein M3Z14_03315 [Candidatus Eremiobacteraeota bacterium]|nr:hypothetical protein [Candidatus Eremiobacteraeota bacterium]
MIKQLFITTIASAALLGLTVAANADNSMMGHGKMMGHGSMAKHSMSKMASGPDHGMPEGTAGGDGVTYKGKPDLQAAVSLVVAGGPIGNFSVVKAITVMSSPAVAKAEVAKLTKQYGSARVGSFVAVQNFTVNDAVKKASAAGVKFPKAKLTGGTLAKRVVASDWLGEPTTKERSSTTW